MNNDDISLIKAVIDNHDRQAFGLLVNRYQSPIRRFFLAQTMGDGPLSDDLAQDTFIKAYTHLHQFQGTASFSTWLYRIAYNVYYDHTRRHRQTEDVESSTEAQRRSSATDDGLRIDLYKALQILSQNERTCITLQLIDGYKVEQIAAITAMAEGTVKSHLSRGKAKLATYLKENGYGK